MDGTLQQKQQNGQDGSRFLEEEEKKKEVLLIGLRVPSLLSLLPCQCNECIVCALILDTYMYIYIYVVFITIMPCWYS